MLSVPYALSSEGWLSLIALLVVASVAFHTGLLIHRCMEFDPELRSYPDIGNLAFGNKGRIAFTILMCTELYFDGAGFLIMVITYMIYSRLIMWEGSLLVASNAL